MRILKKPAKICHENKKLRKYVIRLRIPVKIWHMNKKTTLRKYVMRLKTALSNGCLITVVAIININDNENPEKICHKIKDCIVKLLLWLSSTSS